MAQMKCPNCKEIVSTSDKICSHCDFVLQECRVIPATESETAKLDLEQKNKKLGCLLVGIIIFVFMCFLGVILPDEDSKKTTQSATPSIVKNLPWDHSVIPVKNHIKNSLKDPSSLEFIRWGNVIKTADGTYIVNVKYRAKNSFGGYVVNDQIFTMSSSGQILKINDY